MVRSGEEMRWVPLRGVESGKWKVESVAGRMNVDMVGDIEVDAMIDKT